MNNPIKTKNPGQGKTGILVSNLGTPDAPTPVALRKFLKQFLSDPRVVTLPRFIWLPFLYGVILRKRPKLAALNYEKIWTDEGSPLLVFTQQITDALKTTVADEDISIELGMRYGNPSIEQALQALRDAGTENLIVLPLYPQHSFTTTASTSDEVQQTLRKINWQPALRFIEQYCDDKLYIDALALSVQNYWQTHGRPQRLLMSFHGLPQDYSDAGDPYAAQCEATAALLAKALHLETDQWQLSYQSRFGPRKWLQPYTEATLEGWAKQGIDKVHVVCPGFAADCLETLEEISMRAQEVFIKTGGSEFRYIPALNNHPAHIAALRAIAESE